MGVVVGPFADIDRSLRQRRDEDPSMADARA
jgi:hypothetical protein